MAPKVLVVLTSHDQLGDTGRKTGWYLPEFAHPYHEFQAAGIEVTVASPLGGAAPLDPSSIDAAKDDSVSVAFLEGSKALWASTTKLSTLLEADAASQFDAIFYPGGHGPVFDLPVDAASQALISQFASQGKVVAAVCHGPAVFANVTLPSGEHLVKGKAVTGFSNAEEEQIGLSKALPFLLEDKLVEAGATFLKADEPWGAKVVVDGKLITGQNPASAKGVGEAIVKAISA
ncbi:class I glutamine amidotransferase-like protein [Lasiosphaeria miniovina]|uniref:D-lactate dehydratase n=1 Tax=Lasiosphaeria miniovina TaxID=1954250 RepID=A0AA39ZR21_9PEZI|nr:class I glutamine amidotransferase-like protein [Lasiosphaeria miniovina]KAK0702106.1 class I glutamine amidotransferase-like protein [Lasiosphaeria miniovina]